MKKTDLNLIMMELKNNMDKKGIKVFYSISECNNNLYLDVKFNYRGYNSYVDIKNTETNEIITIKASTLLSGSLFTNSRRSKGEQLIKLYLDNNNIYYVNCWLFDNFKPKDVIYGILIALIYYIYFVTFS